MGKLALIAVLCVAALGSIGFRSDNPTVQALCAILAVVTVLAIVSGILWFSDKHPDQATLEGMEIVLLRQQQQTWAAKGVSTTRESPVVPDPQSPPEQLLPPEDLQE